MNIGGITDCKHSTIPGNKVVLCRVDQFRIKKTRPFQNTYLCHPERSEGSLYV